MLFLLSHQVVFDSSCPHGLQHARLPCLSPSPRIYPSSCHTPSQDQIFTGHSVLTHSLNKRHWSSNFPFSLLHYQFFFLFDHSLQHWNIGMTYVIFSYLLLKLSLLQSSSFYSPFHILFIAKLWKFLYPLSPISLLLFSLEPTPIQDFTYNSLKTWLLSRC